METLKKVNKKALKFLQCVQTACHNHRMMIENSYKREYSNFVSQWKKSEETRSAHCKDVEDKKVQDVTLQINIEELCLADDLLQRARNMRVNIEKSQSTKGNKTVLGCCKPKPKGGKAETSVMKIGCQNIASSCDKKVGVEDKLNPSKLKASGVQSKHSNSMKRSVSNNTINVRKPNKATQKSSLMNKGVANCICEKRKRNKSISYLSPVVVSAKELKSFKSVCSTTDNFLLNSNSNEKRLKNGKKGESGELDGNNQSHLSVKYHLAASLLVPNKAVNADNEISTRIPRSLDSHHTSNHTLINYEKSQPTNMEFRAVLKNFMVKANVIRPSISWSWYPFLSAENEFSLSKDLKCNSTHELEAAYIWLHKIQEVMLWLDFITLLHNEISPCVQQTDQIDRVTLTAICDIHKIMF